MQEACPKLSFRVYFLRPVPSVLRAHTAGLALDAVCKRIVFRVPLCEGGIVFVCSQNLP